MASFFSSIFMYVIVVTFRIEAKSFYETLPKIAVCKVLDPQIVRNYTCTIKTINQTIFTQDINFQPGVVLDNYHIRIQFNRKFGTTFRPFMVNAEQDFCALSNENSIQSLLTKVLDVKDRNLYGNWYQPCPVSGRRYEIDVPVDLSKLPSLAMIGEFRLDVIGFTFIDGVKKEFRLTHHFGEIRKKSKKNS